MSADCSEKSGSVRDKLGRRLPLPGAHHARGEDFGRALSGEGLAAHERAVMTMRLTLLLLLAGAILFLFNGFDRTQTDGRRRGGLVEYSR